MRWWKRYKLGKLLEEAVNEAPCREKDIVDIRIDLALAVCRGALDDAVKDAVAVGLVPIPLPPPDQRPPPRPAGDDRGPFRACFERSP